jgi:hypothetical protein
VSRQSPCKSRRLVAAGIATLEGFDLEAVEDLRISVDEGCVWLIDQGDGSQLTLVFSVDGDGRVEVRGDTGRGEGPVDGALGALAAQILAASCSEHRFDTDDGRARFSFVARSSSFSAGVPVEHQLEPDRDEGRS